MITMTKKLSDLMDELKKRNAETYYHSLHVKKLTCEMLRETDRTGLTGYTEDEVCSICKGALLHDIGKLFINNSILTKAASLNEAEMNDMRKHTRLGCEAVKDEMDEKERDIVLNICRFHHERIDGSGYENRTELPLYVQIVSICDVFDALCSNRIYRKAFSKKKALEMIRTSRCGCFSDELVDCLARIVQAEN